MNTTAVAFGICADNNDPWGIGRIRVIIDNDFVPPIQGAFNIKEYIARLDNNNTTQNGENAYIPWEVGADNHMPDPYVFEPFLPKHINIIPKVGESVKIIYYATGDSTRQREYVGPHTSNYDKLNFESIDSARAFSKKTTHYVPPDNLRAIGLVADAEDIGLYGRNNSDIVLPDNAAFIRAGHQDFADRVKNNRCAMFQASHFVGKKDITTEKVTVNDSVIANIDYMMEFFTQTYNPVVNPLYIETTVYVYQPKNKVTTGTYSEYGEYVYDPYYESEYVFQLRSNNTGNITSFIQKLLKELDNSYSLSSLITPQQANTTQNFEYEVLKDLRTSTTGAAIDETYNLGLYQVRVSPKSDLSVAEVESIKNALSIGLHPASLAPTRNIVQQEKEVTKDNLDFGETVIVSGADKIFLLSWSNTQMLQNRMSKYGFSQDEIYLTLQKNTQPMVKGDLLLKLLVDILGLIEQHGHAGIMLEGGNTLNENAKTLIKNIKENYALFDPVAKDLSGGALLLNQYLRLN